jgi:Na+/H+ antiporter NhaD/arsenite permease-like protein
MNNLGITIFCVCYAGIAVGSVPGLALDRTGVALLGAMLLVATGVLDLPRAIGAIDFSTLTLLFGLMLLSARFRLGGFYDHIAARAARAEVHPRHFLGLVIIAVAGLSAVLSNDVICLVLSPILIEIARKRRWNPMPFLLSVAAASNIGSAATVIGNPQNMFIGQKAHLGFGAFLLWCGPPTVLGLVLLYLWAVWKGGLDGSGDSPDQAEDIELASTEPYDVRQSSKAVFLTVILVALFFTRIPRELSVLGVAAILLMSRRFTTGQYLGLVDWPLLVLFIGLFVLIEGFRYSGGTSSLMAFLQAHGVHIYEPVTFGLISVVLSNLVSNVPAVMLLMAEWPDGSTHLAYLLALTSTYAGNLILIGSIANLIVAEQARKAGIEITFRKHLYWTGPLAVVSISVVMVWWLLIEHWVGG